MLTTDTDNIYRPCKIFVMILITFIMVVYLCNSWYRMQLQCDLFTLKDFLTKSYFGLQKDMQVMAESSVSFSHLVRALMSGIGN